jgi:hypothetical protein
MAFAEELERVRKEAGYRTVAELSHQLAELNYPVSYFELRRYERGEYLPPLPIFAAIVDALGLTQREIVNLVRAVPIAPARSKSRRSASEAETRNPPPGVSASP